MLYYLIVCRSLTYAQRTAEVLERGGVPNQILRSPRQIAGEGCSHSVKIAQRRLSEALALLEAIDFPQRLILNADYDRLLEIIRAKTGRLLTE